METSEIDIRQLGLMSTSDVARYLDISLTTVYRLTKNYGIPHVDLSTIKVYLKRDIDAMQESRKEKLKYLPKAYQKEK